MRKADYSKIASTYDKGRPLSEQNMDMWVELVSKLAKAAEGARVLDLGCGTGRFAIPMATQRNFRVTGADASEDMLAKAREKDVGNLVMWDRQEAEAMSYPDNTFDVCFMSHLLHHVDSPAKVIRESHRVLRTPGSLIVRYGAIEQIRDDVEHRFFPETLAMDEERTPTVETVENWLADGGFSGIMSKEIVQRTYETGAAHLNAASVKSNSVLHMISSKAFDKGIRDLEAYVEQNPDDPWLQFDRLTLTLGHKG